MLSSAEVFVLSRCALSENSHRTIDPHALKNPRPEWGGTYTNGERRSRSNGNYSRTRGALVQYSA
jgi:hypothetical protein